MSYINIILFPLLSEINGKYVVPNDEMLEWLEIKAYQAVIRKQMCTKQVLTL